MFSRASGSAHTYFRENKLSDFHELLKQARLPERTVAVCLRADLVADHEGLQRQLDQAQQRQVDSLAGTGTGILEERIRDLEADMKASIVVFRLRALPHARRASDPRPTFRELRSQHPAREVDGKVLPEDMMAGWINAMTFPDPLVRHSIVEPELSDEDWENLVLSQGQFDELATTAWELNQGKVDVPFWSGGSATRRSSADA